MKFVNAELLGKRLKKRFMKKAYSSASKHLQGLVPENTKLTNSNKDDLAKGLGYRNFSELVNRHFEKIIDEWALQLEAVTDSLRKTREYQWAALMSSENSDYEKSYINFSDFYKSNAEEHRVSAN